MENVFSIRSLSFCFSPLDSLEFDSCLTLSETCLFLYNKPSKPFLLDSTAEVWCLFCREAVVRQEEQAEEEEAAIQRSQERRYDCVLCSWEQERQ